MFDIELRLREAAAADWMDASATALALARWSVEVARHRLRSISRFARSSSVRASRELVTAVAKVRLPLWRPLPHRCVDR